MSFQRNRGLRKNPAFYISLFFLIISGVAGVSTYYIPFMMALPSLWKSSAPLRPTMTIQEPVSIDIFHTYPPASPPFPRCLILIHGLTPYGAQDPRLRELAGFFARSGLATFIPHFPALAHYTIEKSTERRMEKVYEKVDDLCQSWGLFAISVGAGPALSVLSRKSQMHAKMKVLTLFGSYAHACRILGFGLTAPTLPRTKRQEVRSLTLFQVQKWAKRHNWPNDVTQSVLDTLTTLKTEKDIERLCSALPDDLRNFLNDISPTLLARSLPCTPIFILHSKEDPLIPVRDAYALESVLKETSCGNINLSILPGLTHVDWKTMNHREKFTYLSLGLKFFSAFQ